MVPFKAVILNPGLRILRVQVITGTNAIYLPRGGLLGIGDFAAPSAFEAGLRKPLSKLTFGWVEAVPESAPGKSPGARAFLVSYAFPNPPRSSAHLDAELMTQNDVRFPLNNPCGGGGGPPERSWDLWKLDSLPPTVTNYTLRLANRTNGEPVAEVIFTER